MAPAQLTLRRPDDWHVHLRDGAMLQAVAPATARQFGRAIVMPNLSPRVPPTGKESWRRCPIRRLGWPHSRP